MTQLSIWSITTCHASNFYNTIPNIPFTPIRYTALLLNIDILYVPDTSTKETPYTLISCTSNDSNQSLAGRQVAHMLSDKSNSIPVIHLVNVNSNHFQSLVLHNSEPDNTLSRVTGMDTYADDDGIYPHRSRKKTRHFQILFLPKIIYFKNI